MAPFFVCVACQQHLLFLRVCSLFGGSRSVLRWVSETVRVTAAGKAQDHPDTPEGVLSTI